jgi:hypothetical protein
VRLQLIGGLLWRRAAYEHLPQISRSRHAGWNALALQQRRSVRFPCRGSPLTCPPARSFVPVRLVVHVPILWKVAAVVDEATGPFNIMVHSERP